MSYLFSEVFKKRWSRNHALAAPPPQPTKPKITFFYVRDTMSSSKSYVAKKWQNERVSYIAVQLAVGVAVDGAEVRHGLLEGGAVLQAVGAAGEGVAPRLRLLIKIR